MINKNYEMVGIHHAEWDKSDVGLSQAFKSERYVFANLNNYYVGAYDIIFGGGLDQKKSSYKDALEAAHGTNYKTHLFPNGIANFVPNS